MVSYWGPTAIGAWAASGGRQATEIRARKRADFGIGEASLGSRLGDYMRVAEWFHLRYKMYMAKRQSASSAHDGLKRMTSEDIRNRQWTESEIQALRRAGEAQAAGLDLPEAEYEDIPG